MAGDTDMEPMQEQKTVDKDEENNHNKDVEIESLENNTLNDSEHSNLPEENDDLTEAKEEDTFDIKIDRVVSIKAPSTAPIYENFAREERNKVVTDDTDLMCLIQCKICKKNRREIRGHVRSTHSLTYPEYQQQYGRKQNYTRLTYHRCKLCQVLLVYEFWNFKNHLRREHGMDTVKYCVNYLKQTSNSSKSNTSPQILQSSAPTNTRKPIAQVTTTPIPTTVNQQQPLPSAAPARFDQMKQQRLLQQQKRQQQQQRQQASNIIIVESTTLTVSPSLTITPIRKDQQVVPPTNARRRRRALAVKEEGLSDNLADLCKVECSICFQPVGNLPWHLKKAHDLCFTLYKKKYKAKPMFTTLTHHRCKLCHKVIQFDLSNLRQHFDKKHSMKYKQYAALYLKKNTDAKETKNPIKIQGGGGGGEDMYQDSEVIDIIPDIQIIEQDDPGVEGDQLESMDSTVNNGWSDPQALADQQDQWGAEQDQWTSEQDWDGQNDHWLVGDGTAAAAEGGMGTEFGADQTDMQFSNNPDDMCLTQCQICGTELKPKSMSNHMIHQHASNLRAYKLQFGDLVLTKTFWHRCKICLKVLLFESKTLCYHLSSVHKFTFTDYRDTYLIPILLGNARSPSPPHVIESFTTSAAPCSPSPQADDHAAADDIAAPSSPGAVEELCMEVTEHPEDESSTQESQEDNLEEHDDDSSITQSNIGVDETCETNGAVAADVAAEQSPPQAEAFELSASGSSFITEEATGEAAAMPVVSSAMSVASAAAANGSGEELDEDNIVITDNFNEGSTCLCKLCQREFPVDSFRAHLKNWHGGIKAVDYKVQFGEIEYVRKTYIKCKLCDLIILFEYNKVNSHLMNKHMMTFVEYKRRYAGEASPATFEKPKKIRFNKKKGAIGLQNHFPEELSKVMARLPLSITRFPVNPLETAPTSQYEPMADKMEEDEEDEEEDVYFQASDFLKSEMHEVEQIFVE